MADSVTTLRVEEVEGDRRYALQLWGRALPTRDQPPRWGVQSVQEDTFLRGKSSGGTEPLHLAFPDLAFSGEWKALHLTTGDARVLISPFIQQRTPQIVCDFLERFVARQKVVDVTWSGGVIRRCRWDQFSWEPSRGPDRKWTMSFRVLSMGTGTEAVVAADPITGRTMLAGLRKANRDLDLALAEAFLGADRGFLDRFRELTGKARASLASLRKKIHDAGELARAPAKVVNEVRNVIGDVRTTYNSVNNEWDETAWEYQTDGAAGFVGAVGSAFGAGAGGASSSILVGVTGSVGGAGSVTGDADNIIRARQWKTKVLGPLDAAMDLALKLDTFLATSTTPRRYTACKPGDSLLRVAIREYGTADLWTDIADANGLVGQLVPAGVTKLLIPEA